MTGPSWPALSVREDLGRLSRNGMGIRPRVRFF